MISSYFKTLWTIYTQPTAFFSRWKQSGPYSVSGALAFALITHWLGAGLTYLWQLAFGNLWGDTFNQLFEIVGEVAEVDHPGRAAEFTAMRDRALQWFWSAGPVIIDPFLTLMQLSFTAVFVFIGAKLLVAPGKRGAPDTIDYATALKLVCFGSAPALLTAIPLAGPALAFCGITIVTVLGAKVVYRVGLARGAVIALFPKLLILGFVLAVITFALFFVVRAVTAWI